MKIAIACIAVLIHGIVAKPLANNERSENESPSSKELVRTSPRNSRQAIRILSDNMSDIDDIEILQDERSKPPQAPLFRAASVEKPPQPVSFGQILSRMFRSSSDDPTNKILVRLRRQTEQILNAISSKNQTSAKQEALVDDDDDDEDENANGDSNSIETPNDSNSASSEENGEPPGGGDGQGGGILGLIAGLSGEGGGSDLGTLLGTVASVVSNLSGGEGFDFNTIIGAGVSLFAGISAGDGSQNIGKILASYMITALEGFTGGGAANNGAFFGNLAGSLVGGSSAAGPSSEEGGGGSDSAAFFLSLISAILGASSG